MFAGLHNAIQDFFIWTQACLGSSSSDITFVDLVSQISEPLLDIFCKIIIKLTLSLQSANLGPFLLGKTDLKHMHEFSAERQENDDGFWALLFYLRGDF